MEILELTRQLEEYEQKLKNYERNYSGSRLERADLRNMLRELSQDLETFDMDESDDENYEPDAHLKSVNLLTTYILLFADCFSTGPFNVLGCSLLVLRGRER